MRTCRYARWLGPKRWRDGVRVSDWTMQFVASKEFVLEVLDELVDDAKKRLEN